MLDREYIRQIINEGETLTFDFFGEYCNIEIITKKYKNKIFYMRIENSEPVFFKELK